MERFNDLADFSTDELRALLKLAGKLEREPEPRALQGKVLALLFLSPSLRTLTSFQAQHKLNAVSQRKARSKGSSSGKIPPMVYKGSGETFGGHNDGSHLLRD